MPLADVTLLPLDTEPVYPWMANLVASLELLDPTVLSLPNTSKGFSKIRNLEFQRPLVPVEPHEFEIHFDTALTFPALTLTEGVSDLMLSMHHGKVRELAPIHVAEPPPIASQVLMVNDAGGIIDYLPPLSMDTAAGDGGPLITEGPTRLHVSMRKALVRVQLEQSCGNSELDQLAVGALRQYYILEIANTPDPEIGVIRDPVVWIHWRYRPEIEERRELQMEELFDDTHQF